MEVKVTRRRLTAAGISMSPTAGTGSNNGAAHLLQAHGPTSSAASNANKSSGRAMSSVHAKSQLTTASRSDVLLRPPLARRTVQMSSGAHIRRRPPSVPERATSPHLGRAAVASLRREIIERRTDPSPAPSRPPPPQKRRSLASAPPTNALTPTLGQRGGQDNQLRTRGVFQIVSEHGKYSSVQKPPTDVKRGRLFSGSNGVSIPLSLQLPFQNPTKSSSSVSRSAIVLDAKRSSLLHVGQGKLRGLTPHVGTSAYERAVDCYKKLCEDVGETPYESWITAVMEEGSANKVESRPPESPKCVSPTVGASGNNHTTAVRRTMSTGTSLSTRTHSVGETKSNNKKMFGCFRSYSTRAPITSGSNSSTAVHTPSNGTCDVLLKRMLAYCSHLEPYRKKMEELRLLRQDVREAFDRFLRICNSESRDEQQGQVDTESVTSKASVMTALELRAEVLTKGLTELQRCNVRLLVCFNKLSREVRRTMGTLSDETGKAAGLNEEPQMAKGTVPSVQTQTITKSNTSPLSPLSLLLEPPAAYLRFLHTEERSIVQELTSLCTRVREVLSYEPNILLEDSALFETPLLVPSVLSGTNSLTAKITCEPCSGPSKTEATQDLDEPLREGTSAPCSEAPSGTVASAEGSVDATATGKEGVNQECDDTDSCSNSVGLLMPVVGVVVLKSTHDSVGERDKCANDTKRVGDSPVFGIPRLALGTGTRHGSTFSRTEGIPHSFRALVCGSTPTKFGRQKCSHGTGGKKASKAGAAGAGGMGTVTRNKVKSAHRKNDPHRLGAISIMQLKEALSTWAAISKSNTNTATMDYGGKSNGAEEVAARGIGGQQMGANNCKSSSTTPTCRPALDIQEGKCNAKRAMARELKMMKARGVSELVERKGGVSEQEASTVQGTARRTVSSVKPINEAARVIVRFLRGCVQRSHELKVITQSNLMGEQISHCEEKATALLSADVGDETLLPNLGTCDVMANRILSCWRRYKARAVAKALRDQTARKGQLEQECQYKNIMACRLQRFFVVNYTRKCYKKSLKLHHEERRASSSCRANSKAPSFNDDSSPAAAVRERFDRMREKRKSMLRDHRDKTEVNAASSSSASQRESSLPTKSANHKSSSVIRSSNEQSVLKAHGVPRLHLSSSRLSTYSIENYRPESVTFSVSTLHRLMRAPKPLIYALCVMCDGYETRPETAFEILASSGWGASKGKIKNDEKHGKDKEKTDAAGEGKSESRRRAGSERSVKQSRKQKGERQKMDDDVVLELQSYSAVRHFLMHREADGVVSHGAASSPPCLPALFTYPLSPKVCSFVEKDEMRHYEPLTKSFSRPFEHWNVVLGLQRRIFTAAAVYAWKLIFSHTPHDDYKQRMLNTREEQEARLDRVEQRNRMILACYRVRSETEWLREASSDLNFVGYIWNPKRSLDPNDPDFERHCRETYEFVENFLYQCFPTLSNLDDVPTFLIGAGIFFLLQDTIAKVLKENEGSEQEHSTNKITSLFSSESDGVACPMDKQQRQAVFIYELLGLIDALSNWHDCQRGSKDDTIHKSKSASRHNNTGHLGDNITEWGTVLERSIRAVTSNSAIQLTTTRATNVGSELEGRDVASYSRRLRLVGVPSSNAAGTGEEFALVLPNGFLVELSERLCRCLIGVKLDLEVCEDLNTTA